MTRAEYEVQLGARVFQCRGPRTKTADVVVETIVRDYPAAWMETVADIASAAMEVGTVEVTTVLQRLFDRSMLESAKRLDQLSRTFCGADVRPLFLTHPLDGEWHEAPCPAGCGNLIEWVPPAIEG